jgi:bis(5'-nucleosyl)-tetraphosphatase (symmetrical)
LVRSLGERAVTVLGNHDLTLLAVAEGFVKAKRKDTFQAILRAPDRNELLGWLRHRPMLHREPRSNFVMVHAGLAPQWDLPLAVACAQELESTLRGANYRDFLSRMYGGEPRRWQESLRGTARLRFIVNCLTRIRYCDDPGSLSFADKGPPGSQGSGLKPWFLIPWRHSADLNVVFGHWASLGYYREKGVYALDSGCVWGGRLTALRLDGPEETRYVDCSG